MEKIKPKKSLGQNFLIDRNIAKKIVDSLEISKDDFVVEIGPGTGSLTDFLAEKTSNLVLIEIDNRAVEILQKKFENYQNIKIVEDDFSKINLSSLLFDYFYSSSNSLDPKILKPEKKNKFKVIGNIPYYLTSEILFKLFDNSDLINECVLTIQKEVAQRIVSTPGSKTYGILSIAAKMSGEAKILFDISPSCFHPPPKVISSVIKLILQRKFIKFEFDDIMILIKQAFNQRRKMLRNSLKDYITSKVAPDFFNNNSDYFIQNYLNKRPEELSYFDFKELYEYFNQFKR